MKRSFHFLLGLLTLTLIVFGLIRILILLQREPSDGRFFFNVLFKDAQGLRQGTEVVYRGIDVGKVTRLEVDASGKRVRAQLELDPEMTALATTTTQIWIVRPRFTGIAGDLSGLDTLIRESYLRLRDKEGGEALVPGEEILGLEAPPEDLALEELEDPEPGDLLAGALMPARHQLGPGDPVHFRGLKVGEVRTIHLTSDGQGLLISFRIQRLYRSLVRENSRFWVSRPRLHGSLLTGITIDELGSLIAPSLVFDTPDSPASPASDQTVFLGLETPPKATEPWEFELDQPLTTRDEARELRTELPAVEPLVGVLYQAREVDWLSADDAIEAKGHGLLLQSGPGDFYVITNRTSCDGEVITESGFLDATTLRDERIRVLLEDGRVYPGRRTWVSEDFDIALLHVQIPEGVESISLPSWQEYLEFAKSSENDLRVDSPEITIKNGFFFRDQKCIGLQGHPDFDIEEDKIPFDFTTVPEALRPKGPLQEQ